MKNKSFENRVEANSIGTKIRSFTTKLVDEVVGVAIYTEDEPGISDDKSFDACSFHFIVSRTPETGMKGYQALVGLLDSINAAIKYTYSNNKNCSIKAKISMLDDEPVLPSKLFDDDTGKTWFNAPSSLIAAHDVIEVTRNNNAPANSKDHLQFGVKCWEGTCNSGVPGFVRVLAMKGAIERALSSINLSYPEFNQESKKLSAIFDKSMPEKSSESLSL
jgi:hypothetical protein